MSLWEVPGPVLSCFYNFISHACSKVLWRIQIEKKERNTLFSYTSTTQFGSLIDPALCIPCVVYMIMILHVLRGGPGMMAQVK